MCEKHAESDREDPSKKIWETICMGTKLDGNNHILTNIPVHCLEASQMIDNTLQICIDGDHNVEHISKESRS